jgi:hypothetical protein
MNYLSYFSYLPSLSRTSSRAEGWMSRYRFIPKFVVFVALSCSHFHPTNEQTYKRTTERTTFVVDGVDLALNKIKQTASNEMQSIQFQLQNI